MRVTLWITTAIHLDTPILRPDPGALELDELMVITWTYDPAPRHRSYELLAEAFGLGKLVTDSFAVVTPHRIGRTPALED